MMMQTIKETAKAWVALVSGVLVAVVGFVPVPQQHWVQLGIAVCGAIATWATPNAKPEK